MPSWRNGVFIFYKTQATGFFYFFDLWSRRTVMCPWCFCLLTITPLQRGNVKTCFQYLTVRVDASFRCLMNFPRSFQNSFQDLWRISLLIKKNAFPSCCIWSPSGKRGGVGGGERRGKKMTVFCSSCCHSVFTIAVSYPVKNSNHWCKDHRGNSSLS